MKEANVTADDNLTRMRIKLVADDNLTRMRIKLVNLSKVY